MCLRRLPTSRGLDFRAAFFGGGGGEWLFYDVTTESHASVWCDVLVMFDKQLSDESTQELCVYIYLAF